MSFFIDELIFLIQAFVYFFVYFSVIDTHQEWVIGQKDKTKRQN